MANKSRLHCLIDSAVLEELIGLKYREDTWEKKKPISHYVEEALKAYLKGQKRPPK